MSTITYQRKNGIYLSNMNIQTKRLIITDIRKKDIRYLDEIFREKENIHFDNFEIESMRDEEYISFLNSYIRSKIFFAIRYKYTNDMIGIISMNHIIQNNHYHIGIIIKYQYQNQGLAYEAIMGYLFDFFEHNEADSVYAYCRKENVKGNFSAQKLFGKGKNEPVIFYDNVICKYMVKYCINRDDFYLMFNKKGE